MFHQVTPLCFIVTLYSCGKLNTAGFIFKRRVTMQPYGREFKSFFEHSDSPVFQKLASLIDFVPSLVEGQEQAVEGGYAI